MSDVSSLARPKARFDRSAAEAAIRAACEAQNFQAAATLALEAYGTEIYSFVCARLRSASEADEVFSIFAEDLWKGLPGFAFRSTARGWMYVLARTAANRYVSSPQRYAERNLPLSLDSAVAVLADRSRNESQRRDRAELEDKVRALREQLPVEDRTLLLLFVDRSLPWQEVALIMHDGPDPLDAAEIRREAARLRKRFERLKADLKAMAISAGLLKR